MNVTGHLRSVVRRHPHSADVMIALAVFAATALTTFTGRAAVVAGDRAAPFGAALVACGALAARRRYPLAVLAVSAMSAEAFLAWTAGTGGVLILLAPAIALYTVADQVERGTGLAVGCGVVAAFAIIHAVLHPAMLGAVNLAFTALGGLAIAAGDSALNRRAYLAEVEQRAERAEHEREADARRRVAEERLRIARDLHDSVGHHLALISVQSEVAGRAVDRDGPAAREALGHVKSASRKALDELRDTINLLRQPGEPVAPTAIPAPGLEALEALLEALRDSGLAVDLRIEGAVTALAPAADLTAYRVIQESLTNVYKHSAARRARLTLGYAQQELRITVDDLDGAGSAARVAAIDAAGHPGPAGGGHGIVGMRERVLALGGRFTAGPCLGSAFRVTAALPCQPVDLAPEDAA